MTGKRMAVAAAKQSKHRWKVGACLIDGPRLVVAHNAKKTSPFVSKVRGYHEGSHLHAEAALFGRSQTGAFRGAAVYVYRERKDGSPGLSRPCGGCIQVLRQHQIRKVIYSTPEGWVTETL